MTKWYEIKKATKADHANFQDYTFFKVTGNRDRLKKLLSGNDSYLFLITEWSHHPNNPKSKIIEQLTGDEFYYQKIEGQK